MIEIIKEHNGFGKIIFKLAKSDLIKTYRGSALGWAWAIIKPTVTILVYWFTFSIGLMMGGDVGIYPYFLWLISGMIPWFFMSEMITQGPNSLRKYSFLITKMKFPVSTIPTFVGLSKVFVHIGLLCVVILLFALFGFSPDVYYLQLPFYVISMYLFFTAWSLFSAPLGALSKDFINLVGSFVMALFWMSGVIWDASRVTNKWARYFLKINPITYLSTGYRDVFINKVWFFEKNDTLVFLAVLLIMSLLAIAVYKKLRKIIPDVL